jgi:hypothetical protein
MGLGEDCRRGEEPFHGILPQGTGYVNTLHLVKVVSVVFQMSLLSSYFSLSTLHALDTGN